ncbi:MAG: hypothetical protein CL387_05530 [Acidiferrobacter sp.]|nr:hypothetical protein [Acidiferrobacter sp.]
MFKAELNDNVLALSGRLVSSNAPSAHQPGQRLLDQHSDELFIDLSKTDDVLDLVGIQFLAVLYRSARGRGKQLKILGIQEIQKRSIEAAGFQFLIYDQPR